MPRKATGSFRSEVLVDETVAFYLRFYAAGERQIVTLHSADLCGCGCGGGWDTQGARNELGNNLARARLGIWTPPMRVDPVTLRQEEVDVPLFGPYSLEWLLKKRAGIIGDRPIGKATEADYKTRLHLHLIPFFGPVPLDQIDKRLCEEFKAHLFVEAAEIREALAKGADLRDRRGRGLKPLGPSTISKLVACLVSILDEAVEDNILVGNHARGRRMRVHVPKPKRTFLEMDETACLFDVAAEQDNPLRDAEGDTWTAAQSLVAHCLMRGMEGPTHIAAELGLSRSTVGYHLRRMGASVGRGYVGRRAICELLGRAGMRVSELCELRIGLVRLHDPEGARLHIPDSKTDSGVREVQMSPDLVEVVVEHLDRLRRAGRPTGAEDYLVQSVDGGRLSRQRVAEVVGDVAREANERLVALDLPPLPNVTPHTFRRTYVSVALLANKFDVKFVMGQVGHADSKMTMEVYAQLEQRAKRSHGKNFDDLIRQGREHLPGAERDESMMLVAA